MWGINTLSAILSTKQEKDQAKALLRCFLGHISLRKSPFFVHFIRGSA